MCMEDECLPSPFDPNRLTQGLYCVSTQRQHWKMCPNVLWKNVKLQTLHANSLQPVTSELSGDFHRYSISLTSRSAQSYFNDCHHLCMSAMPAIQPSLQDVIRGQRISVLRKTPSSLLLLWHNNRGVKLSSCKRSVAQICVGFYPLQEINEVQEQKKDGPHWHEVLQASSCCFRQLTHFIAL